MRISFNNLPQLRQTGQRLYSGFDASYRLSKIGTVAAFNFSKQTVDLAWQHPGITLTILATVYAGYETGSASVFVFGTVGSMALIMKQRFKENRRDLALPNTIPLHAAAQAQRLVEAG